jgi:RNA polymerase sigma-70 factor (ECF subfamily)
MQTLNDQELIRLFRQTGEDHHFKQLYDRYRHLVFFSCLGLLKEAEAAKDVSSEVWVQFYSEIERQEIYSVPALLAVIVRRKSYSFIRQSAARRRLLKFVAEEQAWDRHYQLAESPNSYFIKAEEAAGTALLAAAIGLLPVAQQACIRLFFYEGKSYREIAAHTGYTLKQVKSHLQNGRRRLHIILRKGGMSEWR